MLYIATTEEVTGFGKFSFSFDEEHNFNEVDVKKGPDRFRMGYQEVCLKGHNVRSMWDLAFTKAPQVCKCMEVEALR